jgi:hypothetical protein
MNCEANPQHITYLYSNGHYVPASTNPIMKKANKLCKCGVKLSPIYASKFLSKQEHIYCYGCNNPISIRCRICLCERTCSIGHFFCEKCEECKICTTCGECDSRLGLVQQFPKLCCNCHKDIPRRCGNCLIQHVCECGNEYCKKCGHGCTL